jgi:hypothetical protein
MNNFLEEYKKQLNDDSLTEEQIVQKFNEEKAKFNNDVNEAVNSYDKLNMDAFIKRIGGPEKIEQMNKINEKLDRSELVNGKLVEKKTPQTRENIEEWKKGFMEGFEEAYKRLYGK